MPGMKIYDSLNFRFDVTKVSKYPFQRIWFCPCCNNELFDEFDLTVSGKIDEYGYTSYREPHLIIPDSYKCSECGDIGWFDDLKQGICEEEQW